MKQSKLRRKFVACLLVGLLLAAGGQAPVLGARAQAAHPPSASAGILPSQVSISGPTGSERFGAQVYALPNGNTVVVDPLYNATVGGVPRVDAGAVHLYSGQMHEPIGTLTADSANSYVGNGGVAVLPDGNFLVFSPNWNNGTLTGAGAVTWCSAVTGCNGFVSAANSLVGGTAYDLVGSPSASGARYERLNDGGYVVYSPLWDNPGSGAMDAGAVTWCAAGGCTGVVSAANSLVGDGDDNQVGAGGVTPLRAGTFVVSSPYWDHSGAADVGAVTLCETSGCRGPVTGYASLIGTTAGDQVGGSGIIILGPDSYLVASSNWDKGAVPDTGAVTWCSGLSCMGVAVSAANSLTGSTAGDSVGANSYLLGGNAYLVASPTWDRVAGTAEDVGAVTYCPLDGSCNGTVVSTSNSLTGYTSYDHVGSAGSLTPLSDGSYLVNSPDWNYGFVPDAGAVTWCPASGCRGLVSNNRYLHGGHSNDKVGKGGVLFLPGGYVVASPDWSSDGVTLLRQGAVTYCPLAGCDGLVGPANSLTGVHSHDQVGTQVVRLRGEGYAVGSENWDNGAVIDAGAVTACPPGGCAGMSVAAGNSLVGERPYDYIGRSLQPLFGEGGFVTASAVWDGPSAGDVGAVTACPAEGCPGQVVGPANSLVGTKAGDRVGLVVVPLRTESGSFVVGSQLWDNGAAVNAGAVTWCPASGCRGPVTAGNSVLGVRDEDQVGAEVIGLKNGNYILYSPDVDSASNADVGAVSLGAGYATSFTGPVNDSYHVIGSTIGSGDDQEILFDDANDYLIVGRPADNRVSFLKPMHASIADGAWSAGATWDYGPPLARSHAAILNGNRISLDGDARTKALVLDAGRLVLGSANLLVDEAYPASGARQAAKGEPGLDRPGTLAPAFCTGGPQCMIVTNGTGELRVAIEPGGDPYEFPIGDESGEAEYSPARITVGSGMYTVDAYIGVRVVDAPHPLSRDPQALSRYWVVRAAGISSAAFETSFTYPAADVSGAESALRGLYWAGDHWQAGAPVEPAFHRFSFTGLASLSQFTAGNGQARWSMLLPVMQK